MKTKVIIYALMGVFILYVCGPAIASVLRIGQKDGPVIYSEMYHSIVYSIFYNEGPDGKPRVSMIDAMLYERPLFYGLDHRPKPKKERDALIAMKQESSSSENPFLGWLIEANNEIERSNKSW